MLPCVSERVDAVLCPGWSLAVLPVRAVHGQVNCEYDVLEGDYP